MDAHVSDLAVDDSGELELADQVDALVLHVDVPRGAAVLVLVVPMRGLRVVVCAVLEGGRVCRRRRDCHHHDDAGKGGDPRNSPASWPLARVAP